MRLLIFLFTCLNAFPNYKPPIPLSIDGPLSISLPYYKILSERELLNYFKTTGHIDKFYFTPALNFQVGYKEYILHIENAISYCDFAFNLEFYDDVPPLIYGEDSFYVNDISTLEINTILSFYTGYDDYDGYLNVYLQDSNYINDNEMETTLYCHDTSKNKATKKVEILANKKNYGLFIKQNRELTINKGYYLSPKEIIKLMIQNEIIEDIDNYTASFIHSNLDFSKCGKYDVTLNLNYNLSNYEINVLINIVEEQDRHIPIIFKLLKKIIDFINIIRSNLK